MPKITITAKHRNPLVRLYHKLTDTQHLIEIIDEDRETVWIDATDALERYANTPYKLDIVYESSYHA